MTSALVTYYIGPMDTYVCTHTPITFLESTYTVQNDAVGTSHCEHLTAGIHGQTEHITSERLFQVKGPVSSGLEI